MQQQIKQFLNKSWLVVMALCLLVVAGCGSNSGTGSTSSTKDGKPTVEFLYLDHPPVKPVIEQVNKMAEKYKDKIQFVAYNFDSKEGKDLTKERGVTSHTPVAIFLNGSMTVKLGDREVKFFSFPKGVSTAKMAEGGWTYEDLDAALAQLTGSQS